VAAGAGAAAGDDAGAPEVAALGSVNGPFWPQPVRSVDTANSPTDTEPTAKARQALLATLDRRFNMTSFYRP
jgi:hypothetical protein